MASMPNHVIMIWSYLVIIRMLSVGRQFRSFVRLVSSLCGAACDPSGTEAEKGTL